MLNIKDQPSISDPRTLNYIGSVRKECDKFNIKALIRKHNSRKQSIPSKFFSKTDEEINFECVGASEDWFSDFLRVSCYSRIWISYKYRKKYQQLSLFKNEKFDLFSRAHIISRIKKGNCAKSTINNVLDFERACDFLSINRIDQFKLPIEKEKYTKTANLYLILYSILANTDYKISKKFDTNKEYKEVKKDLPSELLDRDHITYQNHIKSFRDAKIINRKR